MSFPLSDDGKTLTTVAQLVAYLQTFPQDMKVAQVVCSAHDDMHENNWAVEKLLSAADSAAVTGYLRSHMMSLTHYSLQRNATAQHLAEDYLVFLGN